MDIVATLVHHRPRFVAFLERRLGDRQAAEDLFQDTFARHLTRLGELRDEDAVVAWFYRSLRNAIVDLHRRRGAEGRALERFLREQPEAAPPVEPAEGGVCRCIGRLARSLKPEYAEALDAIAVREQPVTAFAAGLGLTAANAGVRVFRARRALRRQLEHTCGACMRTGCSPCTCAR
jgi:RNA polymerase sigma-70 factor (ECF subfamily)